MNSGKRYKGKVFNVSTRKVKLPNGCLVNLEIVEHPGAALVIPFLNKDNVMILKQFRPVINSYIYELPAGTIEKGETPLSCAKREIIEEIGYSASRFTKLGEIFPVPGYSTEKIIIFKAENLKEKKVSPEAEEIIHAFTAAKADIRSLFKKRKIVDAKTISAFAMCGWL